LSEKWTLADVVRGELDKLLASAGPPRVPLDLVAISVVASFLPSLKW
jgi:hypothetical protein